MKWRSFSAWGIGFIFSCLFIWATSAVFSDGIAPVEWDDKLGIFVQAEGSQVRFRSEGWSDTRVGKHGLTASGEAVLKSHLPKFIIWGDSFADAVQMDDSLRAANMFNVLPNSMKAFTVAGGGLGIADYYFNISRYEKLAENIHGHAILLAGMEDVMPEQHVDCHSRFLTDPWRFEESACEPSGFALRYASFASQWRLEPIYTLYRFVRDHQFRFALGRVKGTGIDKTASQKNLTQAWAFLVESLKVQTSGFIVFVYVPPVPILKNGRIITVNPEEAGKEEFRKVCESHGVGFVDLSQAYLDLYTEQGRLSRGFFNSPPGGHLNQDAQRLIAEALHTHLKGEK